MPEQPDPSRPSAPPDRVVAVIPARGGSKGVPGKNLRVVGGLSLLARSVRVCRAAETLGQVVVSTDDPAIAAEARAHGAGVIDRPAELAGDGASSESALRHALDELAARGTPAGVLVFVQCTSPLTEAADIDAAVRAVTEGGADTAVCAAPFHAFVWKRDDAGDGSGVNHDKAGRLRRQDREPEWLEAGSVYAMRADGFRAHGHRFFGRTAVVEVPQERILEIDEPADLDRAEALLAARRRRALAGALPRPLGALVFDFDGVMTDNTVLVREDGTEHALCNRSDGLGLGMVRAAGVPLLILSKERNPVVGARARKLGIECLQGIDDKVSALRAWAAGRSIDLGSIAYTGNDVNDLGAYSIVGCSIAVADAHWKVLAAADCVLSLPGGRGAVREVCDAALDAAAARTR